MSSSPYNYSEKYSLPEYNYKSHPKASYEKNSFSIASLHFCKKAIIWIFSLKPRSLSRSTFGVAFGYFFYIFKFICLMYFIFSKLGFLGSSNKNKAATSNIGPNRESPEYKNIVQKIFTTSAIPQDSYLTGEINPPRNMSRVFAHVNEKMPREYWDWENTTLQFR